MHRCPQAQEPRPLLVRNQSRSPHLHQKLAILEAQVSLLYQQLAQLTSVLLLG